VDTLGFLSLEDIVNVAEKSDCEFCTGCFSGVYPLNVENAGKVSKFDRKFSENID
jgi:amidophosphoribosyltransferase